MAATVFQGLPKMALLHSLAALQQHASKQQQTGALADRSRTGFW